MNYMLICQLQIFINQYFCFLVIICWNMRKALMACQPILRFKIHNFIPLYRYPQYQFCSHNNPEKPNQLQTKQEIMDPSQTETIDEMLQEKMLERLKQLQKMHQQKQELIDSKLKFPVKLCGTKDNYEQKYAYLPERIMRYYRIPQSHINKYLLNMYKASLYAIADRNTSYMGQYWESGLKQAIMESIDNAKQLGHQIKVEENHNYLEEVEESFEIIDSVMFRGLSLNREQNKHPSQYSKFSQADEVGLVTYTPKYLTDNNQSFIDPKTNKNVYEGYQKMMLRVMARIKSPLKINISELEVPDQIYTWEHICIFENQMVAPKHLESNYKLETLMEWLGKYRFGHWKVVDIDNFMLGNSPFRNHYPPEEQLDPIFKGTKMDKSYYIDIRKI